MKIELMEYLICPDCEAPFDLDVLEEEAGQIRSGFLSCKRSGCTFPITRHVPRFVDMDAYADSFSKQRLYVRRHFRYYQRDRSGDTLLLPTTGFDPGQMRWGLTLEAGCGYGRFVDTVQRLGGTIVGIDLSTHSIDLAQDYVGLKDNVHLVQCDLFRLPFRQEIFARIYSIGVLHHTPHPRNAFEALVPYLQRRGKIAIWVYPPSMKISTNRWRIVTTHLPHNVLYGWCILNQVAFSWLRALPGGWRFSYLVPGCQPDPNRPFWLRVMSDFDALSPRYASTFTDEEVQEWFLAIGLQEVEILSRPTSVSGKK